MLAIQIRDLETAFSMVNGDSNLEVPLRHSFKVKKCHSLDLTNRSTVQGLLLNGGESEVKLLKSRRQLNPHHYCPGQRCDHSASMHTTALFTSGALKAKKGLGFQTPCFLLAR